MADPFHRPFRCPNCGDQLYVMRTAYGRRAVCGFCRIRWTWIHGELGWAAEAR